MISDIVDREDILNKLQSGITNRRLKSNYAIIGPRRIGKTKILQELQHRLAKNQMIVATLDFSKYGYDPSEFSQALFSELTDAYRKTLDTKSKILDQVKHALEEIKKMKRMR